MIINPVELMDQQQKEFEQKNPELAKLPQNQDRFPTAYLKPEVYEKELERRRNQKLELKQK